MGVKVISLFCVLLLLRFRKDKGQIYTFINAFLNQYDNEDFDLGIKQFLIEQVGWWDELLFSSGALPPPVPAQRNPQPQLKVQLPAATTAPLNHPTWSTTASSNTDTSYSLAT